MLGTETEMSLHYHYRYNCEMLRTNRFWFQSTAITNIYIISVTISAYVLVELSLRASKSISSISHYSLPTYLTAIYNY